MTEEPTLTLRQLEAFLMAAEAGSIRRASDRHGQSQPGLSAQIAALERALDLRLLERRATGVTLTSEGREIQALALQVKDIMSVIADHGPRGARRGGQRLRLGVGHSIGPYLLPFAVKTLHAERPNLRLIIEEAATDPLLDGLLSGRTDLILTQLPIDDPTIRHLPILTEEVRVMMAADHPLASRPSLMPADLAGQRVLSLGRSFALTRDVERFCAACGAVMVPDYQGTSLDALRIMCSMGTDIAFAPEFYVLSEVRPDGAAVARPLGGVGLRRQIVLAWRQSQGRPAFLDILARNLIDAAARVRAAQAG
jgi:LysR family hydrogen peroxide-inducible transcriptional activator